MGATFFTVFCVPYFMWKCEISVSNLSYNPILISSDHKSALNYTRWFFSPTENVLGGPNSDISHHKPTYIFQNNKR